jgi:hypothetical protein
LPRGGDVLDLQADWSGAQAWYAKAVTLGPSVPSDYSCWGVALANYDQALEYAPNWQLLKEAREAVAKETSSVCPEGAARDRRYMGSEGTLHRSAQSVKLDVAGGMAATVALRKARW